MAKISAQLQKVVKSVSGAVANNGKAVTGKGSRKWINFADVVPAGKFDFKKTATIFDRKATNADYAAARTGTGLAKDIQTIKLGGDMLAGFERDYRMRQRSRIRSFVHVAARANANGTATGPLTRNSIEFLTRIVGES